MSNKNRIIKSKWIRRLLRVAVVLVLLFVGLVIFIQSRWGQNIIVSKAVTFIEGKIGTEVSIDKLYLTYTGDLSLEGFYVEDQKGDSLVYSDNLQVSVALMPLINGTKIHIRDIDWSGLMANVHKDSLGTFNFDYIIDAFASADSTTVDSTASPEFILDALAFNNFRLKYDDRQQDIVADMNLGGLKVNMDVFDLEQMNFEVDNLEFSDSKLVYLQNKKTPSSSDTTETESTVPTLKIQELYLNNLQVDYNIPIDKISIGLDLGNSSLKDAAINLSESKIALNSFNLENTEVHYRDRSTTEVVVDSIAEDTATTFIWPNYQVDVEEISLVNNNLIYQQGLVAPHRTFNASDLQIEALTFRANDIHYVPEELAMHVQELTLRDADRFWLKNLAFDLGVDNTSALLSGFNFSTQNTTIRGEVDLNYPTFDAFLKSPETATFSMNLPFRLNFKDLGYFQPDLLENPYLKSLSSGPLKGEIISRGSLDSLTLESLSAQWQNSSVSLHGVATSVLDTEQLAVRIPEVEIRSNKTDIHQFVPPADLGISLPDSLQLEGRFSGGIDSGNADLKVTSTAGNIAVAGDFLYSEAIKYTIDLRADQLNLGYIIGDEKWAPISMTIKSMGAGSSLNTLTASLTSSFDSLNYAGYDLTPLKLNGQVTSGVGDLNLGFKDENLDLNTVVEMELDSVRSVLDMSMGLNGINLYELGLTKQDVRAAFNLNAKFQGNMEDFELRSRLEDGVVVSQNNSYDMGVLELLAKISNTQTTLEVNHNIINGQLQSNVNPQQLTKAFEDFFSGYVRDSLAVDTTLANSGALVDLNFQIKNAPLLSNVLLPGLQEMHTIDLALDFDQQKQLLSANLNVPHLNYSENEIDSLRLDFVGAAEEMDLKLGWKGLTAGPVGMGDTELKGAYKNRNLQLQFQSRDSLVDVVNVSSDISFKNDSILIRVLPDNLILNREPWQIGQANQITYANGYIEVNDFQLSNEQQRIGLERKDTSEEEVSLRLLFENFKLATLMSLLNPGEPIVKGVLNGNFEVDHIFTQTGVQTDLDITNLEVLQIPLGNLSMEAVASGAHNYQLDLSLKEGNVDLDMQGNYLAMENDGKLDFSLDINKIQLKALELLADESIANADGYISGNASISGNTSRPVYQGELNFHQVTITPTTLNTQFGLEDESVSFNNEGFQLNTVEIMDVEGNAFTLDGIIGTEEISVPTFDLVMKANQFKVLNSKVEDNELFYGKVGLDTDITIKGNVEIPVVRGNLRINEGSSFTVVVPESQLDINEREGVVVFVNKSNTNDILTQNQSQTQAVQFMEDFDLDVVLNVDKNSTFKIIMDKRTGDNLEVTGLGEFSFRMEPNGRTNLSGQYEVEDGHYEASLYNIVKRRFDIAQGSRITWSGDPLEAQLDIQAIYNVETSASALMATQTVGVSEEVMQSYRQKLPFMVYLNIDGELLSPELSFQLDMPEESQAALGGNVYGYIQQLNNQEEELNKQVFSLLVLNRFFPSSGSDGSAGGPASIARDNVNNVLSDQLNTFSNKLMGNTGVELDFGLDSYTDYQSATPQERTELDINASKSLFDDRLVIQVGSEVDIQGGSDASNRNAPVIGNVALEYLITRDGRYRLRGYRKNQFESVVDGELIVTGISLIFSKEFNKLKELWEREIKEEIDQETNEKDVERNDKSSNSKKTELNKENSEK